MDDTVARAGDRLADVFVGIDVFGRGCFGGGGYNSNLVRLIHSSVVLTPLVSGTGGQTDHTEELVHSSVCSWLGVRV